MASKSKSGDGITIVGGRPMHRAVPAESLPQGVEQVLTVAALDPRFRREVSRDPVAAAASKGIALDEVEATLLRATAPAQLAAMAERLVIPPDTGRREFVKAVSASIVALVTGKAMLLCSGCTGADAWDGPDGPGDGDQKWMNLAGHTCYVYIPASVASTASPAPVLVALHGEGENCLSSVQRWYATADSRRFNLLAINWTDEAATPTTWDALVADLPQIVEAFAGYYPISTGRRYLTSRGASAEIAWRAGYLSQSTSAYASFAAAVLLGGVPDGDWVRGADDLLAAVVREPALYYVVGTDDEDYRSGTDFFDAIVAHRINAEKQEVIGTTDTAVLDFSTIWQWVTQYSV